MNEFYIQRHFKLWEDNNKLINRVVFLTVVLSLALVIKVLIPFVDFSEDKKPVIQTIESLKIKQEAANKEIAIINKTTKVLKSVDGFISQQPWQQEKKDLINRYKSMRISPPPEGYTRERYQQEADGTINKIADLLTENILNPLQHSIVGTDAVQNIPERLIREVASLDQFIVDWKGETINKDWYRTIQGKDRTMRELTENLNQRLDDFSRVVKAELAATKQAKSTVDKELKILNAEIVTEADKLQVLDDELQKILPNWLRGLVNIEQVIQLLPVALLGVAFFVLTLGISLTRHYNIYVTGKEFPRDITNDPGMSTTWTIIHRGFFGSIQTIAAYTLFIIFTWLLFERSMLLLLGWLSIDPSKAWVDSYVFWESFLWLSRAGFVLLLTYSITRLRHIISDED